MRIAIGLVAWSAAMVVLGIIARIVWFLISLGWHEIGGLFT